MPEEQLSARAICGVEDVRSRIPGLTDRNTTIEPKIVREINAESNRIHERARREFKLRGADPQTRRFDVGPYDASQRTVAVGDLASSAGLVVVLEDIDGTEIATVVPPAYVLLPRDGDREASEPYGEIWFPRSTLNPAPIAQGYVLKLTGTFGFPSIPDALRDECANNCAAKIMRRLPTSAAADEEGAQQQLRVSYRVTDSHRAPRG